MDTAQSRTRPGTFSRWIWTGLAALLVAATGLMWLRMGSDLFIAMLVAGWTACFG